MSSHRAEKRLLPVVRLVVRLLLGLPVEPRTPFLGLLRKLLQRETAALLAEEKSSRLPSPPLRSLR
jgi:hypothetical protein